MIRSRNVFLFGAGAALDWNAPSTAMLTAKVRNSGILTTDRTTTITEFIFRKLRDIAGYAEEDINFETIINVIEELIVYYSQDGNIKKVPIKRVPSLMHSFFTPNFEEEILNYSVEEPELKPFFKLQIPKGVSSDFAPRSEQEGDTPQQVFLQYLLVQILSEIVVSIQKYSYYTLGLSRILTEGNQELNTIFLKWIDKLNDSNILRMYTLNYERNIKIILEKSANPYKIFEGFECGDTIEYDARISPNVQRILTDFEANIHYNLHGSIFWKVEYRGNDQLPAPKYFLTAGPNLPINDYEQSTTQSEKGKTIMLTNIITGYQKTQKAILTPFRQMQAAFDRDCCVADSIFIIGYSFGDEHINASIKSSIAYNDKVKFVIVDPGFMKIELDVVLKIFPYFKDMNQMHPQKVRENVYSYFDGRVMVHTNKFKDYMNIFLEQ